MIYNHSTIDFKNPVSQHHLNDGLVGWILIFPWLTTKNKVWNLVNNTVGTIAGTFDSSHLSNVRPGGFGSFRNFGASPASYISTPYNTLGLNSLQTGTISMWVKWNEDGQDLSYSTYGTVIGVSNSSSFNNKLISLSTANLTTAKVVWQPYSGTSQTLVGTTIVLDKWRYITVTFTSGSHKLYIDGKLDKSGTTAGTMNTTSVPVTIGYNNNSINPSYSNANIDDIRVYNKILSEDEVYQLYRESLRKYPNLLNRINTYFSSSVSLSVNIDFSNPFESLLNILQNNDSNLEFLGNNNISNDTNLEYLSQYNLSNDMDYEILSNQNINNIIDFSNKLDISSNSIINQINTLQVSNDNINILEYFAGYSQDRDIDYEFITNIMFNNIFNTENILSFSKNDITDLEYLSQYSLSNITNYEDNLLIENNEPIIDISHQLDISKNNILNIENLGIEISSFSTDSIINFESLLSINKSNEINTESILSFSKDNNTVEEFILNKILTSETVFDFTTLFSASSTNSIENLLNTTNSSILNIENLGTESSSFSTDAIINFESLLPIYKFSEINLDTIKDLTLSNNILISNLLNYSKNNTINIDSLLLVSKDNIIPTSLLSFLTKNNIFPIAYGFSEATVHYIYVFDSRNRVFELSSRDRQFGLDTRIREIQTEEKNRIFSLTEKTRIISIGE